MKMAIVELEREVENLKKRVVTVEHAVRVDKYGKAKAEMLQYGLIVASVEKIECVGRGVSFCEK